MKPIVNFFLSIYSYYLFTVGAKSVHGKSLFAQTSLAPSVEIQFHYRPNNSHILVIRALIKMVWGPVQVLGSHFAHMWCKPFVCKQHCTKDLCIDPLCSVKYISSAFQQFYLKVFSTFHILSWFPQQLLFLMTFQTLELHTGYALIFLLIFPYSL